MVQLGEGVRPSIEAQNGHTTFVTQVEQTFTGRPDIVVAEPGAITRRNPNGSALYMFYAGPPRPSSTWEMGRIQKDIESQLKPDITSVLPEVNRDGETRFGYIRSRAGDIVFFYPDIRLARINRFADLREEEGRNPFRFLQRLRTGITRSHQLLFESLIREGKSLEEIASSLEKAMSPGSYNGKSNTF